MPQPTLLVNASRQSAHHCAAAAYVVAVDSARLPGADAQLSGCRRSLMRLPSAPAMVMLRL
eukprot:5767565-Prymnesium_polylepis.2